MTPNDLIELNRKRLRFEVAAILMDLMVIHNVTPMMLASRMGKTLKFVEGMIDGTKSITLDELGAAYFTFGRAGHLSLGVIESKEKKS